MHALRLGLQHLNSRRQPQNGSRNRQRFSPRARLLRLREPALHRLDRGPTIRTNACAPVPSLRVPRARTAGGYGDAAAVARVGGRPQPAQGYGLGERTTAFLPRRPNFAVTDLRISRSPLCKLASTPPLGASCSSGGSARSAIRRRARARRRRCSRGIRSMSLSGMPPS
jgi:hypothetical protein